LELLIHGNPRLALGEARLFDVAPPFLKPPPPLLHGHGILVGHIVDFAAERVKAAMRRRLGLGRSTNASARFDTLLRVMRSLASIG